MNLWVLGVIIAYVLFFGALTVWSVRRFIHSRKLRLSERRRPRYECGNALSDWERATEKSLQWSQTRRNKGGK